PRYRGLIQSLVARELKARYRGSVLGFFWSFFNPLLLLLVYTFVFTVILPGGWDEKLGPRALFLFCGLLPWTWCSSSLIESSNIDPISDINRPLSGTPAWSKTLINLNPFTHLAVSYQEILFSQGPFGHWKWLLALGVGSFLLFLFGYFLFDRLRDSFAEEV